ncbi:DNA helicase RecQ [Erysipelothrix piscisicarius]|uniref:DNA helicase RecQ n=1 Tax=Erysipelothrix piscisicarius TaxID=2485784 RepID=UPI002F93A754
MNTYHVLKDYFGFDAFRSGQEAIIEAILSGQDVLALMPTGGGKSLCYQVPAVMMEGITIVVSPLISLMKDQVNALNLMGIPSAYINSSLNDHQKQLVYERAWAHHYKLIYVAPEQLLTQRFRALAQKITISQVSIDEAHCVSQWGNDFRPQYLDIPKFIEMIHPRPVVTAFTATATERVREEIKINLKLSKPLETIQSFDRPNLFFQTRELSDADKKKFILDICKKTTDSGIVYCQTRNEVETVTQLLRSHAISALGYHGGMDSAIRIQNQDAFIQENIQVMVATNAFGMGIDKSNVRFVIHHNMPKELEGYYQEAGRAGRDGQPATCILLYNGKDIRTNQFFIEQLDESHEDLEYLTVIKKRANERLSQMVDYSKTTQCLRYKLMTYFDEPAPMECNQCFNCLNHYKQVDVTIEAQKIMSCILRMDERYGSSLVIDVLRGSKIKRIMDLELDKLSTYGIMRAHSKAQLEMIIQGLIDVGYVQRLTDQYNILKITAKGKLFLMERNVLSIRLPKDNQHIEARSTIHEVDTELLQALKSIRKKLADQRGVPPFVIFSDVSLIDMCSLMPRNPEQFLSVKGVGKKKLELYGTQFLECIHEYI